MTLLNTFVFIYFFFLASDSKISFYLCLPGWSNPTSLSGVPSDDLPLPVAVSVHPPVPALSSRRPQRSMSVYSRCGLPLLRPLRPPTRCCLCGSGHQHYLPVCYIMITKTMTLYIYRSHLMLKHCINALVIPRTHSSFPLAALQLLPV